MSNEYENRLIDGESLRKNLHHLEGATLNATCELCQASSAPDPISRPTRLVNDFDRCS